MMLLIYIGYDQSLKTTEAKESQELMGVLETERPPIAVSYDLPTNVSFAGELVPMTLPDVRERLDKELQINVYLHSSTLFLLKRANRWFPQMEVI